MVESWKPYCANMIERSEDKTGKKHMTDAVVVLFDSTSGGTYCGSISESGTIQVGLIKTHQHMLRLMHG